MTSQNPQKVIQKLLREKRIRVTALRQEVLEVLLETRRPLTHTEIFERLCRDGRVPDRVTLYRTLSAFSEVQIVHQIQGTDGAVRFCPHDPSHAGCPGNHPHFLCQECGRMICLSEQPLPRIEIPAGSLVEGKQMLIFGVCADCCRDAEEGVYQKTGGYII